MLPGEHVEVERIGGFAGFGLPGSHLRSRGRVALPALTPQQRQDLDALFDSPPAPCGPPDAFRYRLTRHRGSTVQAVVVDEVLVPEVLRGCVGDELA